VTLYKNIFCHRLSDHLHFTNRCIFVGGIDSRTVCPWYLLTGYTHGCPQEEQNGHFPLEIGTKNKKCLENLTLAVKSRLIHLSVAMKVYLPVWHWQYTESGSLLWCHAVMRLQFIHVRSFACRKAGCETSEKIVVFGLYCVTMTRQ